MALRSPDSADEGAPLELTTAGDIETLVRARGTRFIVTNKKGDVSPAGARELGLVFDDTRYLSRYELSIRPQSRDGEGEPAEPRELALVHLSSDSFDLACNRIDLMVSGLGSDDALLDDPQNFLHVRRRQFIDEHFREQIEVVNYLPRRVHVEISLSFAADFADVFEIRGAKRARRGRMRPPVVGRRAVHLAYDGLDGTTYVARLGFSPTPARVSGDEAAFHLTIEPGGAAQVEIDIAPDTAVATDAGRCAPFDARLRAAREDAARYFDACTRFRCDNATIQDVLEQSTKDLRALSLALRGQRIVAAGIPWFCCPFGRDTLLTAYEALTLDPELAASTLRALAMFQGTRFDEFTEEEPGKIFHELRFGEMTACKEIPHSPYYGTIDATPLFVVVAHATHKVTGDDALLAELMPAILAALRWIDARSAEGTRLVTYRQESPRGLENQGWKDSRAALSFPDGRRAEPPIALSEVQGYCVDAYRRGASLLESAGDPAAAAIYAARAERLRSVVERALYMPDFERYAFAVDGHGVPLPTVVSNVGHLLWSRLPSPARARSAADLLIASESLSAFGIRTLAAGQPVYNPLSYHNGTVWPHDNAIIAKGFANYDLMDHACAVFEALASAMTRFSDRRLPELFCGIAEEDALVRYPVACSPQAWAAAAPFLLLQSVLGIHVDGVHQRIFVRNPRMPASMSRVEIEGLRVGRSRVSLRLRRVGKRCHVDRLDVVGAPLRTIVEIE
ncbi:MAG: amylo-alpha-1,6-glucosidase [Labilithrix sp.]|nr:amylo-alpha-1,6-glucosidase [Labilithrix sp.]